METAFDANAVVARAAEDLAGLLVDQVSELVVREAEAIQTIAAPTFFEEERAAYVRRRFAELGLSNVTVDEVHNVYGAIPRGRGGGRRLMVTAHTDTVFDATTDLTLRRQDDCIAGPGIGDNSVAVAALIQCAALLVAKLSGPVDLWFVATTGEEGLGNLRGMRAAFDRLHPDAVLNLEGIRLGYVYNAGIAVRRLRITAEGPGGHSWTDFGTPSAVHELVRLASKIVDLSVPADPKTTYNIGLIEGGRSVNSIAASAGFLLDLRSEDQDSLAELESRVRAAVRAEAVSRSADGITWNVEVVGDRPAGSISSDHPLCRIATAALMAVGRAAELKSGSTDGNIPLAAGCPAVTVGVTEGGNVHRSDEYLTVSPIKDGLRQILINIQATAAWLSRREEEPHRESTGTR